MISGQRHWDRKEKLTTEAKVKVQKEKDQGTASVGIADNWGIQLESVQQKIS